MEHLRVLLVTLLMGVSVVSTKAIDPPTVATHDAMVVLHLTDLDDDAMAALARTVGAEKDVILEYSCVWSGIVVMKFSGISVAERADVITLARRQLTMAKVDNAVEFLHVHVEERGPGKC
ncbi:MAG: hypothetical protein KDC00_07550 [Flavobacteriales bacterium]|nr:hypothetical protein [Flavobacteriales bacterium]